MFITYLQSHQNHRSVFLLLPIYKSVRLLPAQTIKRTVKGLFLFMIITCFVKVSRELQPVTHSSLGINFSELRADPQKNKK